MRLVAELAQLAVAFTVGVADWVRRLSGAACGGLALLLRLECGLRAELLDGAFDRLLGKLAL
ncbi:MAG: hypothetical protein ABSG43_22565 [Solirubrobacteraceae bacterium]